MIWSGIGVNYGHQSVYDVTQTERDFSFLSQHGVTRLRIVFPPFSSSTLANCEDVVQRALHKSFYVVWGISTSGTVTATTWATFKTNVVNTIAPWAQANGIAELCLANEVELHVDGTTLTTSTVRSDLRSLASTVKSNGFTGLVSYATSISSTYRTPWVSEGLGAIDLIGWNSYDTYSNFNTRNSTIVSAFGNSTYISEFGSITNGYSDYADETSWYTDVVNRIQSMQSAGVQTGYFFCYRDGGFGVPQNSFALLQNTELCRVARSAVLGN